MSATEVRKIWFYKDADKSEKKQLDKWSVLKLPSQWNSYKNIQTNDLQLKDLAAR